MDDSTHVDITPDKSLVQKLGLVGYRTEQAVAELLDNSIDARIPDKMVAIQVQLNFQDRWICVRDDGHGMDRDGLANAMTIARGTKVEGELGQFGIGMKSACSALGKKFIISTSKINSDKEYSAGYDEKSWLSDESQSWENFTINERTLKEEEDWHGTKIVISELNVSLYPNQVSKFKDNFGIRYFPYLKTGQVSIQINTVSCKPEKPDTVEGSKKNIRIELGLGEKINGHVALLKKRSIKGRYGLHLFKNGRLIKAYEKFGFAAHPENAKIIGDLNLDHVPVNFNKSAFIEESPEYQRAVNAIRQYPKFRETIQSSKSKSQSTVPIKSLFDYFNNEFIPLYMDRSVRSKVSQELLDNTKPFTIKTGGNTVEIEIKPLKNEPLYIMEKHDSKIRVTINRDDEAFGFVKNPLYLIGTIASEIRLLDKDPNFEIFLKKRNQDVHEFLNAWSKKGVKKEVSRDRDVDIPHIPNYGLADELIEVHDYLKENFGYKFQFTALSTLTPYLHNLRGMLVYTLYTEPSRGEYLSEVLAGRFEGEFTVIHAADRKTLDTFLRMPAVKRIISIREYAVIRGATIATPEKAFLDLLNETHSHGSQLDMPELERMFAAMKRSNLINSKNLQTCAKLIKKSGLLKHILEDELW